MTTVALPPSPSRAFSFPLHFFSPPHPSAAPFAAADYHSSQLVKPESLTRWNKTKENVDNSVADEAPARFPFEEKLNRKIILWKGNLCDLQVDAIVNTTNERLNEQLGVSGLINQRAGPDLLSECLNTDGCHTGEAVMTRGYNLPAKAVIHTVGPRFSVKYQTAAENALHGCYRRCLEVLKENDMESIAFPLVNTDRKGYPKESAAHIAVRTVRRFLEKYGSTIHTVIFCMDNNDDMKTYTRILPLYFPRDLSEQKAARDLLPRDVGNDLGESIIADRQIRISAMPGITNDDDIPVATVDTVAAAFAARSTRAATASAITSGSGISGYEPPEDAVRASTAQSFSGEVKEDRKEDFGAMQENPDDIRRRQEGGKSADNEDVERRYAQFLRQSREEDLSDMEALNFIYPSGVDAMGRPVIVFVAHKLPATTVDLNRILLYMIKLLDPIVNNEYTVVYFHTNIAAENKPPFSWLKQVYEIFNRKYKKNLKKLYIVHPTFWVKLVLLFATPFVSSKFWKKLQKVEKLTQLFEDLDPKSLNIDESILKYDQDANAADYAAKYKTEEQKNGSEPSPTNEGKDDGPEFQ